MTRKSAGVTFGIVHVILFGVFITLYFGVFGNRLHDATKDFAKIDVTLAMLILTLFTILSFFFGRWQGSAEPSQADPIVQETLDITDANFRRFREQTAISQDFGDKERETLVVERNQMLEHFAALTVNYGDVKDDAAKVRNRLMHTEVFEKMARGAMGESAKAIGADAFGSILKANEAYRQSGGDLESYGRDFSAGRKGGAVPASGRGKFAHRIGQLFQSQIQVSVRLYYMSVMPLGDPMASDEGNVEATNSGFSQAGGSAFLKLIIERGLGNVIGSAINQIRQDQPREE